MLSYEPRLDHLTAVLAMLQERPDGMTPGNTWRAVADHPAQGEAEFRWDVGTLISAGLIERNGPRWRTGQVARPPAELNFGSGPWNVADSPVSPVETAGGVLLREGLWRGGSVFARGAQVWTADNAGRIADTVAARCRDHPGNFGEGLRALLPVCSDDARVLLAELLALSMLTVAPDDLAPAVKRRRVLALLDEITQFVLLPAVADEAFDHGLAPPGTWQSRDLWPSVQYLAEFAVMWLTQSKDVQNLSRVHEHAWYSLVLGAPGGDAAVQREALLFLGHPQAFVPVFTGTAKRAIAEGLATEIGYREPGETIDATLAAIAIALQAEFRTEVDFYAVPWAERWQPFVTSPELGDVRQAWFVRDSYPGGGDYLGEWLHEGTVAVPEQERTGEWSRIGEGDLVAVATREVFHLGLVAGPADVGDGTVRRPVRWLTEQRPIELNRLRGKLETDLDRQERVIEMRAELELLASMAKAFS